MGNMTIMTNDSVILRITTQKQRTCYQIRCLFYSRNAGYYTLISTSTPLGSSSFISASTVLAVEL